MTFFSRKRLIGIGIVLAFVVAIAAIGAISKSSSSTAQTTISVAPATGLPLTQWWWTMAVSPSNPDTLVVGTSSGLELSGDGGKTWKATGPAGVNATSLVVAGNTIFMGGAKLSATGSPVIRQGAGRAASDGASVFASSTDEGSSWKTTHPAGLPNTTIQSLAVDPDTSAIYALLNNGKVYRSSDNAASFKLFTAKIGVQPWAIALMQGSHFLAGDMDTGNHTSTNGKTWIRTKYADSSGGVMVMEYAPQPKSSTHLLMSAYGVETSTDGGKTWHVALKSKVMFGPVAWSPSKPDTAYAVGFDPSVWRTDDGGKTWTKVS